MVPVLAVLLALQAQDPPAREARQPADSASMATAYADAGTAELVRRARERREVVDRSIRRYEALVQEHISVSLRALLRERVLFRREVATRIDWRRDGDTRMTVVGAREAVPIALPDIRLPDNLTRQVTHLAINPADSRLPMDFTVCDDCDAVHPLAVGSEREYRFESGDTTVISLPDGRRIRLLELRFIPRRNDWGLVAGSFHVDAETHGIVQALFRPARPFDLERDGDDEEDEDDEDIPWALRGLILPVKADIRYVSIEYGLWELRWWLPRIIAFDGVVEFGRFGSMPMRYERVYGGYVVEGDTDGLPPPPPITIDLAGDTTDWRARCVRPSVSVQVDIGRDSARGEPQERHSTVCQCERGDCRYYVVDLGAPDAELLASEHLPPSMFEGDESLLTQTELETLKDRLEDLVEPPWQLQPPKFELGLAGSGLVRYNRVEGLSFGGRTTLEFGRLSADATARIGIADWEPGAELGLQRDGLDRRYRLAAYRRLTPVTRDSRGFSLGTSLESLLFGREDEDYYRTGGAELIVSPVLSRSQRYRLRLFAERQWDADKETDFSLPHVFDGDRRFRETIEAARADQIGAALSLNASHGVYATSFRAAAELYTEAATGTFEYVKPSLLLRLGVPLPGSLAGAVEVAGGTSEGDVPAQSLWYLGGPATLRGYRGSILSGTSYARGRVELGNEFPAARLALFSDVGWAGDRDAFDTDDALVSAGIGISLLDGLVRMDLARALRAPTGWRFDMYVNGSF